MNALDPIQKSPGWGPTTKLVIGLTIVASIAALLIRFNSLIGPLILAVMLTYLLHPVASRLSTATRLSWRTAVNIIFLLLVVLFLSSFTLTGFAVAQQLQSLVNVVQGFVNDVPALIDQFTQNVYLVGPYRIDPSIYINQSNIESLIQETMSFIQPLLGRAGGLVSTIASGTAATLGWGFFIALISFFLLSDMGQMPNALVALDIPGYNADFRRLGGQLGAIWNAFLRGQLILFSLTVFVFSILLSILGVRYAFGLALLAGLARFVPYIGPFITWTVTTLVAIFQSTNYFNLDSWKFALLVVILAIIVDQIFDNVISPRFLGVTLGVHPAGVLVAAIIAANLIGFVGVVLAAPD
jgi:predicted PurR-regulated permease PerM